MPLEAKHIPLSDPENNPIMVAYEFNQAMGRWDAHLIVGNFATEAEAKQVAEWLAELAEEKLGSKEIVPQ